MKTKFFTLLFGLATVLAFPQKKEIYLNDDSNEISQTEFNEPLDLSKFYKMKFESDTQITNVKVQRIKKGKIEIQLLDAIKSELSANSGKKIPDENMLVLNYFQGPDPCSSTGNKSLIKAQYDSFLNQLKKMENVSQFFVYSSTGGINQDNRKLDWTEDKSGTIENTFLPLHYPCGSFVLIDKDGNYYLQKGEYDIDEIIELIKKQKNGIFGG